MNPAQLAAMLGFTIADLAATSVEAKAWSLLGSVYRSPSQFAAEYATTFAGLTQFPTKVAQAIANYWAFQGQYLGMLDPSGFIPPQFMEQLDRISNRELGEMQYRYDVQIMIHYPDGSYQPYWVHVDRDYPLSIEGARQAAFEQLVNQFVTGRAGSIIDGDPEDHYQPEFLELNVYRHS